MQIATAPFSRQLLEQVAIFQVRFRKDDSILANPLSKMGLLFPSKLLWLQVGQYWVIRQILLSKWQTASLHMLVIMWKF